jgi:cbb3-type cytochrome oxidase subunit 3
MVALVAMLVPWFVLGYVSWIFWKAKKRDEAEERREDAWRNAPSS